jgi:hypothetical protein
MDQEASAGSAGSTGGHQQGAAGATGSPGSTGDGQPSDSASEPLWSSQTSDATTEGDQPRRRQPLQPPTYFGERLPAVLDVARAVISHYKSTAGTKTYATTWRDFTRWHVMGYGVDPPRCPHTGLLWLHITQALEYTSFMAAEGKTSSQVSSSFSFIVLAHGMPYHHATDCRATLLPRYATAALRYCRATLLPRYATRYATLLPRYLHHPYPQHVMSCVGC